MSGHDDGAALVLLMHQHTADAFAGSDIPPPRVPVHLMGEMACTTGADDAPPLSLLAWAREWASWMTRSRCFVGK